MQKDAKVKNIADAIDGANDDIGNATGVHAPGDNKKLKGFIDKLEKLNEVRANNNADIKSVYEAAEDAGFDRADIKFVLRFRNKEMSDERKDNINWMLETLGQLPLFAFAEGKAA